MSNLTQQQIIDLFKDAPEGATHYAKEDLVYFFTYFKNITNESHEKFNVSTDRKWVRVEYPVHPARALIAKPQVKHVFTQEFRVLGGTNEVWQKCKIVFKGKRYTVVENENGKEFSRKTANIFIRDIDTRTDKQKAIAEILSYEHTQTFEGLLSDAYDKWIGE